MRRSRRKRGGVFSSMLKVYDNSRSHKMGGGRRTRRRRGGVFGKARVSFGRSNKSSRIWGGAAPPPHAPAMLLSNGGRRRRSRKTKRGGNLGVWKFASAGGQPGTSGIYGKHGGGRRRRSRKSRTCGCGCKRCRCSRRIRGGRFIAQ